MPDPGTTEIVPIKRGRNVDKEPMTPEEIEFWKRITTRAPIYSTPIAPLEGNFAHQLAALGDPAWMPPVGMGDVKAAEGPIPVDPERIAAALTGVQMQREFASRPSAVADEEALRQRLRDDRDQESGSEAMKARLRADRDREIAASRRPIFSGRDGSRVSSDGPGILVPKDELLADEDIVPPRSRVPAGGAAGMSDEEIMRRLATGRTLLTDEEEQRFAAYEHTPFLTQREETATSTPEREQGSYSSIIASQAIPIRKVGGEDDALAFEEVAPTILRSAAASNVDPTVIDKVLQVESRYRPNAKGKPDKKGRFAKGMGQFVDSTWQGLQRKHPELTNPYDPEQNIMAVGYLLRENLDRPDVKGDMKKALAVYFHGPEALSDPNLTDANGTRVRDYVERTHGDRRDISAFAPFMLAAAPGSPGSPEARPTGGAMATPTAASPMTPEQQRIADAIAYEQRVRAERTAAHAQTTGPRTGMASVRMAESAMGQGDPSDPLNTWGGGHPLIGAVPEGITPPAESVGRSIAPAATQPPSPLVAPPSSASRGPTTADLMSLLASGPSSKTIGELEASGEREAGAVGRIGNDAARQALIEARATRAAQVKIQREQERLERRAQVRQQLFEDWRREDEAFQGRMQSVPPATFFSSGDTAGGVLANIGRVIAVVLGGVVSNFTGRTNMGAVLLGRALEDDIERQRMELGKIRTERDMVGNRYAQALATYGDVELARNAVHVAGLQQVDRYIQMTLANTRSQTATANAQALQEGIRQQILRLKLANDQHVGARLDLALKGMDEQMQLDALRMRAADPDAVGHDAALLELTIPERAERAKATEEIGSLQKLHRSWQSISSAYDRVAGIGAIAGNTPFTESKAAAEAEGAKILASVVELVPGLRSDADMRNVVEKFKPLPGDTVAQVRAKQRSMREFIGSNAPPTPVLRKHDLLRRLSTLPEAGAR